MAQHFLISPSARSLSIAQVIRLSDAEAFETFKQVRFATNGGANFMVYMESQNGGAPTFWVGQNAVEVLGGGVITTYVGDHQVPGTYTPGAPGTITITVPLSAVHEAGALDSKLYQVTASTQTLTGNAETPGSVGGIGGTMFNLIDVAPGCPVGLPGQHRWRNRSMTSAPCSRPLGLISPR